MMLSMHFKQFKGSKAGREWGEMVQTVSSGESGKRGCKVPWQAEVRNSPINKRQKVGKPWLQYLRLLRLRMEQGEAACVAPWFHCEWENYVQVTKCV